MADILDEPPCYDCPSCGRIHYDTKSIRTRLCFACGGMGTWGMRNGQQSAAEHSAEVERHQQARQRATAEEES